MKALVFAAGLGTRLRPLTDDLPKALVKVGGVTMLERVIRRLSAGGYDDIVVNAHHFGDMVEQFVAEHDFGCKVRISDERDLLRNTGGGIRHAEPLLSDAPSFLVHNVDIISNLDLGWFRREHESESRLATLLVSERETARYFLFDDDMRLVGWTNVKTGELKTPWPDLDPSKCRHLAFAGVHIISSEIFPLMKEWPEEFSIVDFYLSACRDKVIKAALYPNLVMRDLGTPASVEEIEKHLQEYE